VPWLRFAACATLLSLAFLDPLVRLAKLALASDLHSYLLLIPFISAYLIYQQRRETNIPAAGSLRAGVPFLLGGLAVLLLHFATPLPAASGSDPAPLVLPLLAFVAFQIGAFAACLGRAAVRTHRFPLLFLVLLTPLPDAVIRALATGLQHASADTAYAILNLVGTPILRDGLILHLPGLSLEVAEECSGIRSTLVLFITSLLAGQLLLKRPANRLLLAAVVLPLGVLRNAVRIITLALLTIHVDPGVIDSPLHHKGGPIFFALSLPLLLGILWLLRRIERRHPGAPDTLRQKRGGGGAPALLPETKVTTPS
jgi:exosortase C (VPDSG-CTERM-specific)